MGTTHRYGWMQRRALAPFGKMTSQRSRLREVFVTFVVLLVLMVCAWQTVEYQMTHGGFSQYAVVMLKRQQQKLYEETQVFYNICFLQKTTPVNNSRWDYDFATFTAGRELCANDSGKNVTTFTHLRTNNERYCGKYHVTQEQHHTHKNLPVFSDKLAIIPLTSLGYGFYHFLYNYVLCIFGLTKWMKENQVATDSEISNSVILYPRDCFIDNPSFRPIFEAIGPHEFQVLAGAPSMCFKKAVFGRKLFTTTHFELSAHLTSAWDLQPDLCPENLVVIVQRETKFRTILNAEKIKEYFRQNGFVNTQLVVLERLSIREQLSVIQCASVFIAVQGAGMSWFMFLPKHAVLAEITWYRWPSRFIDRARYARPDIETHLLYCDFTISNAAYAVFTAKYFGYNRTITDEVREQVIEKSKQQYARDYYPLGVPRTGIWKLADCCCDIALFQGLLRSLQDKLS